GDWHALNGRWAEAAARFDSVMKVNKLDAPDLISEEKLKLAAAFLKSGNLRSYEQLRETEVARLSPTDVASDYRTFKLGLLLPPETNMLNVFVLGADLVEKTLPDGKEMNPSQRHVAQWSEALALLEYRHGHFQEAINWGYRCQGYPEYSAARTATTSLILAMSGWQSTGYENAVAKWTAAYELIQAKSREGLRIGSARSTLFPGAPQDLEGSWYDWVIADLLMSECDELIAQSDRTLDPWSRFNAASNETAVALARALGQWHAIRGEWELAHNRFSQLPEDGPAYDYLLRAMTALKLGEESEFSTVRDQTISRFNGTTDLKTAEFVMLVALLRPVDNTTAATLKPFAQIVERAVAGAAPEEKTQTPAPWDLTLLGLFEYRRGNYANTLDLSQRGLVASAYIPMPAAMDRLIRAMSFHKLGEQTSARSEFDEAKSLVQSGQNVGFDSWNWSAWVAVRLLLQEADGLIPQAPLPESPK